MSDSDNQFGHLESKEGDRVVGVYEVSQPDGRDRVVSYTADDQGGFVANVTYSSSDGESYVYR